MELYKSYLYDDPNLVAYYRLEDTSDSKGSYTLTNNNSVAFNAAKFGNGADFGSSNTTKWLNTTMSSNLSSSFTFSCWFNTNAIATNATHALMHSHVASYNNYWAFLAVQNAAGQYRVVWQLFDGTNNPGNVTNIANISGSWNHIAGVRNTATDKIDLYLNGALIASANDDTTSVPSYSDFRISNYVSNNYMSGKIDDIAIFSRALTAKEVLDLYGDGTIGNGQVTYLPTSTTKAYYPLNNDILDYSGNGYNLTNNNSVTIGATNGRFGGGADFAGTNQTLSGSASSVFDLNSGFTLSFWANPTAWSSALTPVNLISKLTFATSGWMVYMDSVGATYFFHYGLTPVYTLISNALPIGVWSHIAITYNGSTCTTYVDGVLAFTNSTTGTPSASTNALLFGRYDNAPNNYYNGKLDETIFSNYAWTAKEVMDYYSNSLSKFLTQ